LTDTDFTLVSQDVGLKNFWTVLDIWILESVTLSINFLIQT